VPKNDIKPGSGNVFADLALEKADRLHAKAVLMSKIASRVAERKLSKVDVARILALDNANASGLIDGKLSMFSIEKLTEFLAALAGPVE
jgi:predicted XRE-type DNA-binding protein